MLSFDEARKAILETAQPLGRVRRKLENLMGYALAEPLKATHDSPRFDNSAMDGFGIRMADAREISATSPARVKCLGVVAAGDAGKLQIRDGEAIKIFTGAPVPPSVDAVVMREDCTEQPDGTVLIADDQLVPGENIRRRGEEFSKGQEILPAGTVINPAVVGLLAGFGMTSATVIRKPKICFVITGSELIKPGGALKSGQIYESNSYTLMTACREAGFDAVETRHAPDDPKALHRVLKKALDTADVVIPVGGVSVGDYDLVKEGLAQLGVETIFWRIAMKPGKPVYFGTWQASLKKQSTLVFGLPGNPVSALVTFHSLVKPALYKMAGHPERETPWLSAVLDKPLKKKPGRMELVRGVARSEANRLVVSPTQGQDSHMLSGLARANCLIHFPVDAAMLQAGDAVLIELLS